MIMEITAAPKPMSRPDMQELVGMAVGRAVHGLPYAIEISPDYVAYVNRLEGARLYRNCCAIEFCTNVDQRTGWREEEEWYKGQAQYVRALELEDCPATWAEPYCGRSDAWYDRQMNGEIPF